MAGLQDARIEGLGFNLLDENVETRRMSYSLNSLKRVIWGIRKGSIIGIIRGY